MDCVTPAVLNSVTSYLEESKESLSGSSLRFIRSSGAPLTKKTREYFEGVFQVPIVQTYGLSEAGNVASTYQLPKGLKEGSVGTPRGVEVKILDGEVLVHGDTVFAGYENPEESNDEYFVDGWFRTGDAGYLDEDGYLFITGRFKEMINRGGEKVSPYEVESAIQRHTAVADAAAFPIPNSYGSEDVGAVVVLKEGAALDIDELRSFLTPYISSYKMPTKLFIAGEVPVGGNHKVQRRRLYEYIKGAISGADRARRPPGCRRRGGGTGKWLYADRAGAYGYLEDNTKEIPNRHRGRFFQAGRGFASCRAALQPD
jgi:oxalate---CoA ligase